jgi:hypothetical protein
MYLQMGARFLMYAEEIRGDSSGYYIPWEWKISPYRSYLIL